MMTLELIGDAKDTLLTAIILFSHRAEDKNVFDIAWKFRGKLHHAYMARDNDANMLKLAVGSLKTIETHMKDKIYFLNDWEMPNNSYEVFDFVIEANHKKYEKQTGVFKLKLTKKHAVSSSLVEDGFIEEYNGELHGTNQVMCFTAERPKGYNIYTLLMYSLIKGLKHVFKSNEKELYKLLEEKVNERRSISSD